MKKSSEFDLNVDQVAKINKLLPKGYKLITIEDNNKRISLLKKKPKIALVPLVQVAIQQQPIGRRNKANVSYYQGDEPIKNKPGSSEFQSEKSQRTEKAKSKKQVWDKQFLPSLKRNQSIQLSFPMPVFNKIPLTPKQILEQLQIHRKFHVIKQFMNDFPQRCTYNDLLSHSEQVSYGLHDLLNDMRDLFINIYGSYSRTSEVYSDAAQLEGFLTSLINTQKGKLKQPKPEKPKQVVKQISYFKQQVSPVPPPLIRAPSQLMKKKTVLAKTQIKNITITDKRILGQNIKKLQSDYLPQICKIVYETLQTRQEYVIDIDTLPLKKVKQLQIYVASCLNKLDNMQDQGNDIKNQVDESESSFMIMDDYSD